MSEEIQAQFIQLQQVHQQLRMLQQNMQELERQSMELVMTKESIKELSDVKKGTSIYVPLANGIFAKATWDADEYLVNVGGGCTTLKTAAEVSEMIKEQQKEAERIQGEMTKAAQELVEEATKLEKELK